MPQPTGFNPQRLLRSLMHLRTIAILSQLAVIAFAVGYLHMQLPLPPMLGLVGVLAVWNLLVLWRLRRGWPVSSGEVCSHLLLDSAVLTGLLYWAGGPTNPFVSLYLVPIAIAATSLPTLAAWTITLLCVAAYSALFYLHEPLPHSHVGTAFDLHVLGMWANFVLSAGLIAGFVSLLARALRRRDAALATRREQSLRDEQILALATQAAGAAHELNTPLATLSVLITELRDDALTPVTLHSDLDLMGQQVEQCRQRLRDLVDESRHSTASATALHAVLDDLQERWRLLRPEVELRMNISSEVATILSDNSLPQALLNLLNNAADASLKSRQPQISLSDEIVDDHVYIHIDDCGPGLSTEISKPQGHEGLGLGLTLSNASIERLGGEVSLQDRETGGARASVRLPLFEA